MIKHPRMMLDQRGTSPYFRSRSVWLPHARQQDDLKWLNEALGASEHPQKREARYLHLALPDGRGYLLPQNSRRAAAAGLALYPAQKPKARIAKRLLSLGLRSGLGSWILPKAAVDLEPLCALLTEVFERKDLSLSVSLGTPGPHRKPVIQVASEAGEVLGYVKIGWNEETKRLVEHEAQMLRTLTDESLPFRVPHVISTNEDGGRSICVQSRPPEPVRPAPGKMDAVYLEALNALVARNLRWLPLSESSFWQHLQEQKKKVRSVYCRHLLEMAMEQISERWGGCELPFHYAHGDFTPWNAFIANGSLYLYDWEYALKEAPAGYDIFHFAVQQASLVKSKAPGRISKTVLKGVLKISSNYIGFRNAEVSQLFSLYLVSRMTSACMTKAQVFDECERIAISLFSILAVS